VTLPAFQALFSLLGYNVCEDESLESRFQKVALFADSAGIPTHTARQLTSGLWTSKVGELEDIEHALHALAGERYGTVVTIMKRPILQPAGETPPQPAP
jgi:hypothetical protein